MSNARMNTNPSIYIRTKQLAINKILDACKRECYFIEKSKWPRGRRKTRYNEAYAKRDKALAEV